jgi:hypothetical protein
VIVINQNGINSQTTARRFEQPESLAQTQAETKYAYH